MPGRGGEGLRAPAYTVPTDGPEADGTLEWDSTTIVIVEAEAAGYTGIGYTYGPAAVSTLISDQLAGVVTGGDALAPAAAWAALHRALRNAGRPRVGAMAISAVDVALWDLKSRILGVPLVVALDAFHGSVPVYGSGRFTTYGPEVAAQLGGWAEQGIGDVKLKIGRDADADARRVAGARDAIGPQAGLFADANGATRWAGSCTRPAWPSRFPRW